MGLAEGFVRLALPDRGEPGLGPLELEHVGVAERAARHDAGVRRDIGALERPRAQPLAGGRVVFRDDVPEPDTQAPRLAALVQGPQPARPEPTPHAAGAGP